METKDILYLIVIGVLASITFYLITHEQQLLDHCDASWKEYVATHYPETSDLLTRITHPYAQPTYMLELDNHT
jgi:hypothetical protein